ncbi:polyphenol oxidase family protein [Rubrivirga sp.]|uniref:polyphenol oxidase family protein n=1 Tax=Rubrivirga sp. TaxID=1885344 RepID=UPI003B5201DF
MTYVPPTLTAGAILRPGFAADPRVVAGFTMRTFSPAGESLDAARNRLTTVTGMAVASVGQVHGADVAVVQEPGHVPEHDGLVTDRPGLALSVVAADCAVVLLADAEAGVVGACHSGWRGTVAGIVGETVWAMRELGAEPGRTQAYLAPCISTAAFEVGEEVASQFDPAVVMRRPEWPRPHVDLRSDLVRQLSEAGVGRTEVAPGCTVSDGRFYSYRGEAGTTGRMLGFVGLRAVD